MATTIVFGKDRKGNYQLLEQYGKVLSYVVKEINEQVLQRATISSTRIRKAILQHDLTAAKALLGYDYFEGTVIKGDQLGRTIGYPTANIQLNQHDKLVPGDGVYAVTVVLQESSNVSETLTTHSSLLTGMMYIGSRPVVNGKRRVIEVNIFNFTEDIYNNNIQVTVKKFIRGDMHFDGLEALKNQLVKLDEKTTKEALKK